MFRIDDDLKALVESGVGVVLGTASKELRPNVTYVWGPRVLDDRSTIHFFLEHARAEPTLANLQATGLVALTVGDPITYRSVQFKGKYKGCGDATAEDNQWVQRHRDAFASTTALVGDPPDSIRKLWMDDVFRLECTVDSAFDQTPGPEAGRPL